MANIPGLDTDVKFQRTYALQIQSNLNGMQDYMTILPPMTIEFDVQRNVMSEANSAKFTIYNLAPETRASIYHDRMRVSPQEFQKIEFMAGYKSFKNLPLVFLGNIMTANSRKSGVDWRTEIEAFDGGMGYVAGQVSLTVPAGTSAAQLAKQLTQSMDFVSYGVVGDVKIKNTRTMSMAGSAYDIMQTLFGNNNFFIDNGMTFILSDNEYLVRPGTPELVLDSSSILGTPRRFEGWIDVEMLFEPSVYPAQKVTLKSRERVFDGDYQVRGIRHTGTISESVCGRATTTLSLWTGNTTLTPVSL